MGLSQGYRFRRVVAFNADTPLPFGIVWGRKIGTVMGHRDSLFGQEQTALSSRRR